MIALLGCAWLTEAELSAMEDGDGDGVFVWEDCDDAKADVGPAADRFEDRDGDGIGGAGTVACPGEGAEEGGDCDDDDPEIGAAVAWYVDADADGYSTDVDAVVACETPDARYSLTAGADCDDDDAAIHPDALEQCTNGIDDDCDTAIDECSLRDAGLVLRVDGYSAGLGSFSNAFYPVPKGYYQLVVGMPYGGGVAFHDLSGAPHTGTYLLDTPLFTVDDLPESGGNSLAVAELNGDGVWDLVVGGTFAPGEPEVDIVYEPAFGTAEVGFSFVGEIETSLLGTSLDAGDLDGDPYQELMLGAPGELSGCGAAYLLFGRSDPWHRVNTYYTDDRYDGAKLYANCGEHTRYGRGFGNVVLAVPPGLNEERDTLFAISDPDYDDLNGAVYVWTYPGDLGAGRHEISLSDSPDVASWFGQDSNAWAGLGLAEGDLDGNDVTDLVIGAPFGESGIGVAAVILDVAAAEGAQNLDRADYVIEGDDENPSSAFGAAVSAVDRDGDGVDELAVSAPHWSDELRGYETGAIYVFSLSDSPVDVRDAREQYYGNYAAEHVGSTLSPGADLDGDGAEELVVGVDGWTPDGTEEWGALIVLFGVR